MGREHANPPVFSPLFHNKPNQNDGFIRGWRWASGLFIPRREWEFQPRQTKCQIETEVVPGDTTMPSWLPNALNSDKGMICLRRWTMQRQNVWGGCARSRRHLIVLYLKLISKLAIRSAQPFFFFNKECLQSTSTLPNKLRGNVLYGSWNNLFMPLQMLLCSGTTEWETLWSSWELLCRKSIQRWMCWESLLVIWTTSFRVVQELLRVGRAKRKS